MAETFWRTGPTGKAWVLAAGPVIVGAWLAWVGLSDMPRFAPSDPMRVPLVFGPILLGLLIVAAAVIVFLQNLGRTVRVSSAGVQAMQGSHELLHVGWGSLSHLVRKQGLARTLVISDGRRFVRLLDVFVPDFDGLVQALDRREKAAHAPGRMRL